MTIKQYRIFFIAFIAIGFPAIGWLDLCCRYDAFVDTSWASSFGYGIGLSLGGVLNVVLNFIDFGFSPLTMAFALVNAVLASAIAYRGIGAKRYHFVLMAIIPVVYLISALALLFIKDRGDV